MSEAKIQQLRVCFTLEENQLVNSGKRQFMLSGKPKNQIISLEIPLLNQMLMLSYNIVLPLLLITKKDTDVCTYVDLEKNKTIKGKYKINGRNGTNGRKNGMEGLDAKSFKCIQTT